MNFLVRISHSFLRSLEACPYQLVLRIRGITGSNFDSEIYKINTILGHSIHAAIEDYIDSWRLNNNVLPNVDNLSNHAREIIDEIWDDAPTRIFELVHNIPIDEERNYRNEQSSKVFNNIVKFCRIWQDRGFQNMNYVCHEEFYIHDYDEDIELCGAIDLVLLDDDGFYHVLDWKTGSASRESLGRSQLGIYAFLVNKEFSISIEQIRCGFISFKDNSCEIKQFTERDLRVLGKRLGKVHLILENINDVEDENWAIPNEQNCSNCNYATQCQFSTI